MAREIGGSLGGCKYGVEGTKCWERRASWEGVSGVVYVGRQESGSLRHAMVGGPVAAAEITAKPQAFGTESVSRGGSFWSPWREGARRKVFSIFL